MLLQVIQFDEVVDGVILVCSRLQVAVVYIVGGMFRRIVYVLPMPW